MRRSLHPAGWTWAKNLSHDLGIQVDDTIWVSGMVAFNPTGDIVGVGDMRVQADQVFANLAAVLAEAGATMDDVVKITAWLTDMDRYSEYNDSRAAAFTGRLPASATVHSPRLVRDGLLVEVEAVAVLGT
ncbi:MAG: RidA family protein [Candidatus Latescibacteria bacterium]|nr:RidA family protein [Candidatus Latescibacterota bacterium]